MSASPLQEDLGRKTAGRSRKLSLKASPHSPPPRTQPLQWSGLGVRLGQDPADSGARVSLKKKEDPLPPHPVPPSRDLSSLLSPSSGPFWKQLQPVLLSLGLVFLREVIVYSHHLGP